VASARTQGRRAKTLNLAHSDLRNHPLRVPQDRCAHRRAQDPHQDGAALKLSARSSLDRARHLNRRLWSMSNAASAAPALSLNLQRVANVPEHPPPSIRLMMGLGSQVRPFRTNIVIPLSRCSAEPGRSKGMFQTSAKRAKLASCPCNIVQGLHSSARGLALGVLGRRCCCTSLAWPPPSFNKIREVRMTALDRRAFMAATAASIAAPTALGAKECPTAGMDWITMSLEARNLAYNNVEHVGPDNARKKTEGWAAASKTLREQHPQHLDFAYGNGERNKWDLYPANDPKAPCFVHIHGGYWQRGSKEIFACLSEGPLARGWSAALCGYTLAPEATLMQITNELKSAFDWLNAKAGEHGIDGPIIVTGWSAGGHLTSFILDHPKVAAGLSISGVFDLGALRDSPHVNDKVKLSEEEIEKLSPMRRPIVNKPLGIAYGTGELPAMIASSRDYHAYRSQGHVPGDLIPIANTNHFTILDELRQPNSTLTHAVLAMAQYQTS
jgi:arylformamidase